MPCHVANLAIMLCIGDQRPQPKDLDRFLVNYCQHWRGTGLQLGLQLSVLDQIEVNHPIISDRFRVTLEKWLQLNVGVTWGNLELAITNANRGSLGLSPLNALPPLKVLSPLTTGKQ